MMKLTPLFALLLASACERPVSTPPPPADDVETVTKAKATPSVEAVTDAKANACDDAAIEALGDDLYSAGVSLCLLLKDRFPKADLNCGQ